MVYNIVEEHTDVQKEGTLCASTVRILVRSLGGYVFPYVDAYPVSMYFQKVWLGLVTKDLLPFARQVWNYKKSLLVLSGQCKLSDIRRGSRGFDELCSQTITIKSRS